jgi:WD40 repeat protein
MRGAVVALASLLAACSRPAVEPATVAAASPSAPASPGVVAPANARAPDEPELPAGFVPRVHDALPAPDDAAAAEDLPAGATCRVGSSRLKRARDYGALSFVASDRLLSEALGDWDEIDAKSGAPGEEFELGTVTSGVSPSGTCVAATSGESDVVYYSLPSREEVAKRTYASELQDDIVPADDCSVAIRRSPENRACVVVFGPSLEPGKEVCAGLERGAHALSGDGKRIAIAPSAMDESTYRGDGVHVFDSASQRELVMIPAKELGSSAVALSNDGGLVAFADGGEVRVAAVPSGEVRMSLSLPSGGYAQGFTFSPQGRRVAVAFSTRDDGQGLVVIDVATGMPTFTQHRLSDLGAIAFAPDGSRLAYGLDESIRIVDVFTGEDVVAAGRPFDIESAALSPAGDRIVTSSSGHLTVWDAGTCKRIATFANRPVLSDVLVLPGGNAVIGFVDGGLERVDLATGARVSLQLAEMDTRDSQLLTPDGATLVVGMEDRQRRQRVAFVDVARMREIRRVTLPRVGPIGALLIARGGKSVLAIAPGGLAHGDSPTGDTSVIDIDIATGRLGKRFVIAGAAQSYWGAVLERGRVVVLNYGAYDAKTGGELGPRPFSFLRTSDDQRTVLWSASGSSAFLWPADEPLPAKPDAIDLGPLSPTSVAANAIASCNRQSCVIVRP